MYSISDLKEDYRKHPKVDVSSKFENFNKYYSIEELKKLKDLDLVKRLFGDKQVTPRGLFNWIEHAKEPTNCKVGAGSGGQLGILYRNDTGESVLHTYEGSSKKPEYTILSNEEAIEHAKNVLDALVFSCETIEKNTLETKEDYEKILIKICDELKKFHRPRNKYWYWDVDGAPGRFFLKYYLCSFPEKFSTTYSPKHLKSVLSNILKPETISSNSFVMNGQISIFAREIGADCINFESFINSKGFYSSISEKLSSSKTEKRKAFIAFCEKDGGVAKAASQYAVGIKAIENHFSINIDDEYKKDECRKLSSDIESIKDKKGNQRNWLSYLKKYIEYLDSITEGSEGVGASTEDEIKYKNPYSNKLIKSSNIIFRGAPGTGKSYLAKQIAADIVSDGESDSYDSLSDEQKKQVEFVQFHPSYDYSDFVEGLRPVKSPSGSIEFDLKDGVFKKFVNLAKDNLDKKFVFIIDEINRGEISKIFGELFFSIDPGYRGTKGEVSTQYANMHGDKEGKFYIPENVYIIGTMNDIDRSVDTFDFAMRRRFRFIEITAENSKVMLKGLPCEDEAIECMDSVNGAIDKIEGLNTNYQIGAAYFLKVKTADDLKEIWSEQLQPLLQEYVNGMYDAKEHMKDLENAYFNKKSDAKPEEKSDEDTHDEDSTDD